LLYLRIKSDHRLHIVDDLFLDVSFVSQIHVQVGHGGLEIVMAQSVFDIGCRKTSGEHVDRTGVPQAVNGINRSETFRRQGSGEVFSTEPIDAVAGEFLTALIDKEALLKGRLWGWAESRDVELKELSGLGLQLDEAEAVAFAEDGESFLLWVEVVQIKGSDFRGPGA
jgi:hypothetical protein